MADDGQSGRVTVNAFLVADTYFFAHYFEEEAVFEKLQPYYDRYDHRFEVPAPRMPGIRDYLAGRGYDLEIVDDPDEFAVAVRKFTDHPDVVFEESVLEVGTDHFNVFVMRSRATVADAVERGARPLSTMDLTLDMG
ncbi:MAG: hypothetical protein ABEJ35_03225 [Halobacteriaceae archaeon]